MEILRRTPWSRIKEQNSVHKEFLEIVGNGKPTDNVWKETIAGSVTIWISVVKVHHQIRLRILSCGRMSENHREPEVPEEEVPAVECHDGLARITSKELAITHPAKDGILLNACSTRPRVVVGLERSAHSHTVRLMNSRLQGLKRMMTKVQWLCWKREIGKKENLSSMNVTIERGKPWREVIRNWDKNSSKRQSSDARQLGCVFQDMTPPKSVLRKSSDIQKPIQRVKFTKAIARHTKIRDQNPSLGYICPGAPHEPRIRNSKKPSRTRVRSWKHQWLLLCPVKLRKIVGTVYPTKFKQNLRVFWKLLNPQECVWENHYQIIMKTILQEKETISYSTKNWFTNLFLCVMLWKFLQQKQRRTRNGKNWRKFRRGTWQKSEVRKRWSMKQGRRALQFILHH